MKKNLILVGGGGHCRSCIDVIESSDAFTIQGIIDVPSKAGQDVLKYPVIGSDDDLPRLVKTGAYFLVTVGHVQDLKPRARVIAALKELKAKLATVVSSHARVSRYAQLGEGTVVMHQAVINSAAVIGANCIVNTGAIVEHDTAVGDQVHISTGSVINGGCVLGARGFVGSGAVIKEKVRMVDNVFIGASAVVIEDIREAGTYVGNPARRIS